MPAAPAVAFAAGIWGLTLGVDAAGTPLFETTGVFPSTPDNQPNYRIPGIIQARNGDLLVLAEKRNDGPGDIGNHDIVCKRSQDLGKTWGPEEVIVDDDERPCTDLTLGMDRMNGKLWLFFLRNKKEFCYFSSLDHGRTWQGPVSIHSQVVRPEWDALRGKSADAADPTSVGRGAAWARGWTQRYGIGPGNAVVQCRSGRLVVPARHREDTGGGKLRSFSHTFFSDDHGATWKLGGSVGPDTSECQLVELADGGLRVMCRTESAADAPDNLRHLTAVSPDGGVNWAGLRRAEELITPRCHGALERFSMPSGGGSGLLLFSSPASPFRQQEHPYGRYNLTIRLSADDGETWSAGRTIWPHPSAYSDMVVLADSSIGIVYERGPKDSTRYWDEIQFCRFRLDWMSGRLRG